MAFWVNGKLVGLETGGGTPGGGITGPIASINNELVLFDGGLGDTIKGSGVVYASNNLNFKTMDFSNFGRKVGIAGAAGAMSAGLSGGAWMEFQSTSDNDQQIVWVTNHNGTSHGVRMVLDRDGFLGLGESSPSERLHISQNARVDGNIGIGGIAPAQRIELFNGNILLGRQDAGDFGRLIGTGSSIGGMALGSSGGAWINFWQSSNNNGIDFITHNVGVSHAIRTRIDHLGNMGVGTTSPVARHHVNGSQAIKITDTATSYTVLADDYLVRVTSTAAARTITLPTAASIAGRVYHIKDSSGGAGTNNITVDADGSETIDGEANVVIATNYGSVKVVSNGTGWELIEWGSSLASSSNALVEVPLSTATGWTYANNPPLSVASINTALERVVYTCTAGGSGDGYARYDLTTLIPGFDGSNCELIARFVGFTNETLTQTYARIGFEYVTASTGFFAFIRGDGRVEWGHIDSSSLVTGGNTFASAIPVDGTGWLRLRVVGGMLFAAYGQGTTSTQPDPSDWKMCRLQECLLEINGEHCPDSVNVGGSQSTIEAVDVTVSFDNIFVRHFS